MNRFEEARGKPVVSRREGAIVAKFDDFQFDLRDWRIYGYRLRASGVFGRAGGIEACQLDQVGTDVAFIGSREQVVWTRGGRNREDGRAWASRYLGTRVLARDGSSLGEVEDLVFDPAQDRVLALVIGGERLVLLDERVATGSAAVVLDDASLVHPFPEPEDGELPADWWARVLAALREGGSEEE